MGRTYEYKFVRLGQYWGSALFGVRDKARDSYEDIVREHAQGGWRLVQVSPRASPRSVPRNTTN